MVIDRLTASEKKNDELQQQISKLEKRQMLHHHALSCTLHLKLDGRAFFNDDKTLVWKIGETPKMTYDIGDKEQELDQEHADATLFVGRHTVFWRQQGARYVVVGNTAERTTVGEFVTTVNKLANKEESHAQMPPSFFQKIKGRNVDGFRHILPGFVIFSDIPLETPLDTYY